MLHRSKIVPKIPDLVEYDLHDATCINSGRELNQVLNKFRWSLSDGLRVQSQHRFTQLLRLCKLIVE